MAEHFVGDMLVNLMHLPSPPALPEGVAVCRAVAVDCGRVLDFVRGEFGEGWVGETEVALSACPTRCMIAAQDGEIIGFACYDAAAKDYFGPIGVKQTMRGTGVGKALLLATLAQMRADGYGYAIIGWVDDASGFYEKVVGARYIPGGEPENTVYGQMARFAGRKK